MAEADLLDAVIECASLFGWHTAHFRPARTETGWRTAVSGDGKGFPDLVLVKHNILMVELNAENARLRPEQLKWMTWLRQAGVPWLLWRPSDWRSGAIEKVLREA